MTELSNPERLTQSLKDHGVDVEFYNVADIATALIRMPEQAVVEADYDAMDRHLLAVGIRMHLTTVERVLRSWRSCIGKDGA